MSQSEGQQVFESYLSSVEDGGRDVVKTSSDAELSADFENYLQSTLSEKYNDPQLEKVQGDAWDAYTHGTKELRASLP